MVSTRASIQAHDRFRIGDAAMKLAIIAALVLGAFTMAAAGVKTTYEAADACYGNTRCVIGP
jgi:hypothetical protein